MTAPHLVALASIALAFGCGSKEATPPGPSAADTLTPVAAPAPKPPDEPIPPDEPPVTLAADCKAPLEKAGDGQMLLMVSGTAVPIEAPDYEALEVYSMPWQGRILLGISVSTRVHLGYASDGVLWSVDCAAPAAAPTKMYEEAGADFGHAVPSDDGKSLYYSRKDGLGLLDLNARTGRLIMPGPPLDPDCAELHGDRPGEALQRIFPRDSQPEGLVVMMGAECGYEGDWELTQWVITAPEDPAKRTLRRAQTVAALTLGPDGAVWLGDAGCQDLHVIDTQSRGTVWRSQDGGMSWEALAISGLDGAVADIVVDRDDPQHVVVRSPVCDSSAAMMGGELVVTRDGGATWAPLGRDALFGAALDGGEGVTRLWSPDGSADHLFAAGYATNDAGRAPVKESTDGGATWTQTSVPVPAAAPPAPLTVPKATLAPGVLGITRIGDDGSRTHTFPPPNWRVPPAVRGRALPGRVPPAKVGWEQVIAAESMHRRGMALHAAGERDGALAALMAALATNPNRAQAAYDASRVHAVAGRHDDALTLLEKMSERGGFAALAALAHAPSDPDFAALRARPRFRALTTVGSLTPAFFDAGEATGLDLVVASDPHHRLCVWHTASQDATGTRVAQMERVDCAAGTSHGAVSVAQGDAGLADADRWLQGLGMSAWTPVYDEVLLGRIVAWLPGAHPGSKSATAAGLRERLTVFGAPGTEAGAPGQLLALHLTGPSAWRTIVPATTFAAP